MLINRKAAGPHSILSKGGHFSSLLVRRKVRLEGQALIKDSVASRTALWSALTQTLTAHCFSLPRPEW